MAIAIILVVSIIANLLLIASSAGQRSTLRVRTEQTRVVAPATGARSHHRCGLCYA
jgi:hypothetical protein